MSIHVSSSGLLDLAKRFQGVCGPEFFAALSAAPRDLDLSQTTKASELLPTYTVRLERWKVEGVPPSIGLPEFVDALERQGSADVAIGWYVQPTRHFLLLLSSTVTELIAVMAVTPQDEDQRDDRTPG